jgi:hypothetical protein
MPGWNTENNETPLLKPKEGEFLGQTVSKCYVGGIDFILSYTLQSLKYEKSKVWFSRIRRYSKGHIKSHPRNSNIPGIFFFLKESVILSVCMHEMTRKSIETVTKIPYWRLYYYSDVVFISIRKLSRSLYIKTYMPFRSTSSETR